MIPRLLVGPVLIVLASAGCGSQTSTTPPPKQTGAASATGDAIDYPVTFMFDGGYAFLRDDVAKSLTVAAFDASGMATGHGSSDIGHSLRMRLDQGHIVSAPSSLRPDRAAPATWNLDHNNYDISVQSYGSTPAGVMEPPSTSVDPKSPCQSNPTNNMQLMPDLDALAAAGKFNGQVVVDRSKYQNRVILASGTLSIAALTSCMEFRAGSQPVATHPVPSGLGGVHLTFKEHGNLILNLTDTAGHVEALELAPSPDAIGVNGLQVWFGRFTPPCAPNDATCYYAKGQEVADFARFYSILQSPPPSSQRVMPVNVSDRDQVCPGSQCPGLYVRLHKK
jgi:hypothetical protein